jgi:hypothetical protein
MEEKTKRLYAFGPFRLDAGEYVLTVDGKILPLPPKAFESLLMLVENAGHLVDKNELMRRLWPDTFVEDGNLAKHISLLRKTLSEASPSVATSLSPAPTITSSLEVGNPRLRQAFSLPTAGVGGDLQRQPGSGADDYRQRPWPEAPRQLVELLG